MIIPRTICIAIAIALAGCSSGFIGPRTGLNIGVSGVEFTGAVSESSTQVGTIAGFTGGGYLGSVVGIQFDPQVSTTGGSGRASTLYERDGVLYQPDIEFKGSRSTLDLPLMVTFGKALGDVWRPYFGIGGALSLQLSESSSYTGTITATTGSRAGISEPVNDHSENGQSLISSNRAIQPFASAMMNVGVDYALDDAWTVRVDARLQQMIDAGWLMYSYGLRGYYVSAAPAYTLVGVTVAVTLKL